MIRFLIQFVCWGLFFYALSYFFPEAFAKMVSWVQDIFNYLYVRLSPQHTEPSSPATPPEPGHALALFWLLKKPACRAR